jgi:hypothetical protein
LRYDSSHFCFDNFLHRVLCFCRSRLQIMILLTMVFIAGITVVYHYAWLIDWDGVWLILPGWPWTVILSICSPSSWNFGHESPCPV